MFEDKKSNSYLYFIIGVITFILIILLANIFFIPKDKYKTLNIGENFILGTEKLKIKSIEKSIDFLYLELIDYNYIENINKFEFKAKTKIEQKYSVIPEVLYNYKGYYLIKIPLKKNFKTLKFIIEYKNNISGDIVNTHTYFNEFDIKVSDNFREKTKKEYILDYISFLISENKEKIDKKNEEIIKNNQIISDRNNEIKLLNDDLEFKNDEEKMKVKNKIFENNKEIFSLKNEIIKIENEIIDLKNSNSLLESEYIFIENGKKQETKLLEKKKNFNTEEEKKDIENEEKIQMEEENNIKNSIDSTENDLKKLGEINQNITNNTPENKNNTKKSTQKNNNFYIKPKENSNKNKEIEIEFTP